MLPVHTAPFIYFPTGHDVTQVGPSAYFPPEHAVQVVVPEQVVQEGSKVVQASEIEYIWLMK